MGGAVIGMEGAGSEIRRGYLAAGNVSLSNPGALGMREDDRDSHTREGELVNKGVDVGGGELGRGAVVVYHLKVTNLSFKMEELVSIERGRAYKDMHFGRVGGCGGLRWVWWFGGVDILLLTRVCANATDAESLAKTILLGRVREMVHLCPDDAHSNYTLAGTIVVVFVHTYRSRHEVSLGASADDIGKLVALGHRPRRGWEEVMELDVFSRRGITKHLKLNRDRATAEVLTGYVHTVSAQKCWWSYTNQRPRKIVCIAWLPEPGKLEEVPLYNDSFPPPPLCGCSWLWLHVFNMDWIDCNTDFQLAIAKDSKSF